jgi:hypothetical protein
VLHFKVGAWPAPKIWGLFQKYCQVQTPQLICFERQRRRKRLLFD